MTGSSGALEPLGGELPAEARALADALRQLFLGLNVSVRRYAVRRHRDAGTISRYLNGTRIPPWEFVLDLFHDVTDCRGGAPTTATIDHLRELHRSALKASNAGKHRIQLLEDELAEADRRAQNSTTRELAVQDALQDRQHRITDLEMRIRQLEVDRAKERSEVSSALELYDRQLEDLSMERDRLRDEIRRLRSELARAHADRLQAEARCDDLERRLEGAVTTEESGSVEGRARDLALAERLLLDTERKQREAEIKRSEAINDLEKVVRRREEIEAEISRVQDVLEALESFETPPLE
ncbi:hypothetical protein P8605_04795 [Streptomyces sp. T-3]|nr:hypothetical protein [Streptomyces sp. T-3]